MENYILLIDCKDQKGLIHKITGAIGKNDLNVISNSEFVEEETGHFFMRTEIQGGFDEKSFSNDLKEILPQKVNIRLRKKHKKRIVVLGTKEYHCLGDILIKNQYEDLNGELLSVISNYENLKSLVDKFEIPYHFVTHENLNRIEHEEKIIKIIKSYDPDYIVLAKYMRILSPEFVKEFKNKIINIHHSFLPAFIGANPYRQAFIRGVKIIGATAHYVNNNLDEGPIIVQEVANVNHKHTAKTMRQAGREVEKKTLNKALKLVFEERVFISGNKTIIFE